MGYNENAGVQALKMVKCIKIYKKNAVNANKIYYLERTNINSIRKYPLEFCEVHSCHKMWISKVTS